MIGKYKIQDTEHYTKEMSKALSEKLWFLDHVWVESMLDIGCADGTIPLHLSTLFKDHDFKCYAYEPNYNLYWMAKIKANRLSHQIQHRGRVMFYERYREYLDVIKSLKQVDLVLLSSVLHEIYNKYSDDRVNFYRIIKESDARYIAIRDMRPITPLAAYNDIDVDIPSDLQEKWIEWGKSKVNGGNVDGYTYLQFFLKYRYDVNWSYEVEEDYFATKWEELDQIFRILGYNKVYEKNYVPDFIEQDVFKTFNFSLRQEKYTTHTNILYRFD